MQSVKKKVDGGKDSGNLSLSNQSTDRSNDMNTTRTEINGLTIVTFPEVVHTNTSARHDNGCIGKTQRIETYDGDTLLRVERVEFWYTAGRLTHVDIRPLAA
jgi:hypothetical protein